VFEVNLRGQFAATWALALRSDQGPDESSQPDEKPAHRPQTTIRGNRSGSALHPHGVTPAFPPLMPPTVSL
jgi:hypothetical protein